MDVNGKGAVVTGAGGGIGRGIALALAKAGANVLVADVEEAKAKAVADDVVALGVKSSYFQVDVRDAKQVTAMADHAWKVLGRVDILCNNAGVCAPAPALDITEADLRWQLEVNLVGMFHGMREFSRRFLDQGGRAWIVNTGSHNAIGAPVKGVAAYVASKHAILGLTDAFRNEVDDKIGFSLLCPGIINTGIWDAGRNRPAEFGGKFVGDPRSKQALTTLGMNPDRVGELVVKGVQAEEFFIWTHPMDIELIEKRYRECKQSIERQWPDGPDEEHKQVPHDVI